MILSKLARKWVGPALVGLTLSVLGGSALADISLQVPRTFLPGIPVTVKVTATDADGRPVWGKSASLQSGSSDITVSPETVDLVGGVGTALVMLSGDGSTDLTVSLDGEQSSRSVTNGSGETVTEVSGTISESATWGGVIRVTGDLEIVSGVTVTVEAGSIVLLDGTPEVADEDGSLIRVEDEGTLVCEGSATHPVTFTASDPSAPWGGIRVNDNGSLFLRYVHLSRAGHTQHKGRGHTGPAIRMAEDGPDSGRLLLLHCAITDLVGKAGLWDGGLITVSNTVFQRVPFGIEVGRAQTTIQDSQFLETRARYDETGRVRNNDAVYVDASNKDHEFTMRRCVVAGGDDDGVQVDDASAHLEDLVICDLVDTGITAKGDGEVQIIRCLISDIGPYQGISPEDEDTHGYGIELRNDSANPSRENDGDSRQSGRVAAPSSGSGPVAAVR